MQFDILLGTTYSEKDLNGLQEAMRLYSSAVDKFEKVLAVKADNVEVLVICGLALKDMALCMSLDDPDTIINLEVCTHHVAGCFCL